MNPKSGTPGYVKLYGAWALCGFLGLVVIPLLLNLHLLEVAAPLLYETLQRAAG